jgi:hypothetical protein
VLSFFKRSAVPVAWGLIAGLLLGASVRTAHAQVNPAEITDPHLKEVEATYYPQTLALYHEIDKLQFPFSFRLSRYVGLNPDQQAGSDARGLEFVEFENRTLFKVSGSYNAAFSAELLTSNERASRTFSDVIAPILSLVAKNIPADVTCDGIGFEISYHVRSRSQNFDYEGKEILVVVFNRADAFAYVNAESDSSRQDILNRSEIYLNGTEFGLALKRKDPLDPEARGKTPPPQSAGAQDSAPRTSSTLVNPNLLSSGGFPASRPTGLSSTGAASGSEPSVPTTAAPPAPVLPPQDPPPAASPADAERLQTQFQSQLDDLASLGKAKFHFIDYAPPSFVVFRKEVVLQLSLRNTTHFAPDAGSIYKRAAQSFDLFLAPQLKDILDKIPADAAFTGFDITVVNQIGSDPHSSSEAVEFVCPREALAKFVDDDITNQQLIDQSVVLVNGVRIALNLQLVE